MTFATKITRIKCFNFFNSFSIVKSVVLFETIFLLRSVNLLSKSVLVTKFACANLFEKFSDVNLLNSGLVIYLS